MPYSPRLPAGPVPAQHDASATVGTPGTAGALLSGDALRRLVRQDQWSNVRRTVLSALLINALLGAISVAVAVHAGRATAALAWFALSSLVNIARAWACLHPPGAAPGDTAIPGHDGVDAALRLSWILALLSGGTWAMLALLCDGYTTPEAVFYITMLCGITAGSVTYGIAYREIPIAFVTPPLLTVVACLVFRAPTVDRLWLAAAVLLYLAALVRSAIHSERNFRETSRLKHEATALAASLQDANRRVEDALASLHRQATHDALTGLLNRSGFLQACEEALEHTPDARFCLMLLDLDGFKAVNDTLGHQAGDTLLAKVGHWFGEDLPAQLGSALPDLRCGRFGGDEFVLMGRLPAGAHGDAAGALAERIIASFAARSFVTGLRLGVSVGVHSAVGQPVSAMLAAADEALYAAKEAGRNRHAVYDAALETQSFIRRDIERHLLGALQAQQIELHYQPIVAEGGGSVDGFEALLRWQHPVHGMIPPEDIVVAAAHNGLAQQLFEYVLDAALQAAVRLRSSGHGRVRVFVNAAPRDVSQFPIDTVILEALARHELPAAALGIELTGTETLDIARARSRLGHLAETGVSITADGFGVGHASLALIQSRFIGRLKIDRSFVADLGRRHDSEPVISAALGLGRALALEVVAEGVETQAQFTVLRAMGCDRMQGNHFAPPMPLDAATAWLAARRIIATARPA